MTIEKTFLSQGGKTDLLNTLRYKKALGYSLNDLGFYSNLIGMVAVNLNKLINTVNAAVNEDQPDLLYHQYHKMLPTLKILELTDLEERLKGLKNRLENNNQAPDLKGLAQSLITDCEKKLGEIQEELEMIEKIRI